MLWSPLWLPLLLLALLLDGLFGEPRRWHPLVGFGYLADKLQRGFNRVPYEPISILSGGLALLLLVVPPLLLMAPLLQLPVIGELLGLLLLYLCLGGRSLAEHARAIMDPLQQGDLDKARQRVAMIVSRDTDQLDEEGTCRAALESVLENGADAIFATLFWFIVAGPMGAVAHRLVNTLDAMWGYRSDQYRYFGRVAARLDDLMNYIPARLCALGYAGAGTFATAINCWREQASSHDSPNAGVVMAAGAGALQRQLGGPAKYRGQWQQRPPFGCGQPPAAADIEAALVLVRNALLLWVAVALLLWLMLTLEVL
ncbi:adenosylcobinamide-phosphate synthase CbiB [Aestuariirhabdus sp. Z084]|nr:adenosylcobinamide-phosphate synthase CbiB [Aestuariirhabdus haliotis]MCL6420807.1 adenosylcobinamide-phosphate synthase CbiB [Aestuariirhabdus haliotis]